MECVVYQAKMCVGKTGQYLNYFVPATSLKTCKYSRNPNTRHLSNGTIGIGYKSKTSIQKFAIQQVIWDSSGIWFTDHFTI